MIILIEWNFRIPFHTIVTIVTIATVVSITINIICVVCSMPENTKLRHYLLLIGIYATPSVYYIISLSRNGLMV
jgi:hypothetical protein